MTQPTFDYSVPVVDPQREPVRVPFAKGSHSSWTGARVAVQTWTEKQSALLQFLEQAGAATRQELAAGLRWPLSSVCSIAKALIDRHLIEKTGDYDTATFASGATKRERLRVKR